MKEQFYKVTVMQLKVITPNGRELQFPIIDWDAIGATEIKIICTNPKTISDVLEMHSIPVKALYSDVEILNNAYDEDKYGWFSLERPMNLAITQNAILLDYEQK